MIEDVSCISAWFSRAAEFHTRTATSLTATGSEYLSPYFRSCRGHWFYGIVGTYKKIGEPRMGCLALVSRRLQYHCSSLPLRGIYIFCFDKWNITTRLRVPVYRPMPCGNSSCRLSWVYCDCTALRLMAKYALPDLLHGDWFYRQCSTTLQAYQLPQKRSCFEIRTWRTPRWSWYFFKPPSVNRSATTSRSGI